MVTTVKKELLKMQRTPKKKQKTKLAWGSYRTRAAMDGVLLYSETKDEKNE